MLVYHDAVRNQIRVNVGDIFKAPGGGVDQQALRGRQICRLAAEGPSIFSGP